MKRAEHIQSELNELGADILMRLPLHMPYQVSPGYFDALAGEIHDLVKINDSVDYQPSWGNKTPFEAPPANYFEGLAASIMTKVNAEAEFSKTNPYQVPQGYFDALPDTILAKAKAQIPSQKKIPLFRTVRLAASMALIILAGLGVLQLNNKQQNQLNLSQVSKSDISQYVNANLDDFDTDLIISGLASANTQPDTKIEISDAEIKAYLDETGWN